MGFARVRALVAAAAIVFAAGDASADVDDRGLYLGIRALPAVSAADDEAIFGGPGGGFRQKGDDPELTIGGGAMLGYYWRIGGLPVRTEIEYAHRLRLDFDTEAVGPPVTGYKNDVDTDSVMVNIYLDADIGSPWRPYVGAGIGWARNGSDTLRAPTGGAAETRDEFTDNFAYGVMAGVRVAISRSWVAEIGYRYIDMGEIDTGPFAAGDRVTADSHVSHDIILGIAYMF